MSNGKHAFLIMAHGHFTVLEKLLLMLDDERNDIFLHVDRKVKNFDFAKYCTLIKKGKIYITKRISVYWGHSSQVDCEMLLLEACVKKGRYDYVHLISGVDLPIKTQDEIHSFFDAHPNKQFLQVGDGKLHLYRLSQYHFFLKHTNVPERLRKSINALTDIFTYKLSINRLKKWGDITVVKTANWFSITGDCAEYIYEKRKFVRHLTRHTVCADEMFLGTVIYKSKFWNEVYNSEQSWDGHMRYIDRIRNVGASPHTFTMNDKESIVNSEMMFARKFDETVDSEIIDYIFNKYK